MSKFEIDSYVESVALNRNIESFYPIAVAKALNLPLKEIADRLGQLVNIGYLQLKFEIRCETDLNIIEIVDDYSDYLEQEMYCEECNDYIEITLYNIFPVYYIKQEYRKHVKKNIQTVQDIANKKKNCLDVNENIGNIPEIIRGYINAEEVNKKNTLKQEKDNLTIIINNINSSDSKNIPSEQNKIHKKNNKVKDKKIKLIKGVKEGSKCLKWYLETRKLINEQFPGLEQYLKCLFHIS